MKLGIRKKTIDKYENALNVLYYKVKVDNKIKMSLFIKNNGLSANFARIIKDAGIIGYKKNSPSSGVEWLSIKPTKDMAVAVIKEVNALSVPSKKAVKKTIKTTEKKNGRGGKREGAGRPKLATISTRKKKTTSKSFLWGLYSFSEVVE